MCFVFTIVFYVPITDFNFGSVVMCFVFFCVLCPFVVRFSSSLKTSISFLMKVCNYK